MTEYSIQLHNLHKRYPNGHIALNNVSFNLHRREMVFLTGHSGAGKTSLLKIISGIERPTRGTVLVNRHNVSKIPNKKLPFLRRSIGIVFQNPHLLTHRNVFENVALPLIIVGLNQTDIKRRVRAALDKVNLLDKEKYYPADLSGGEQQRVGIARAVVNKPEILLADEPTGNLDPELSHDIMKLFDQFNQVGVSVLVATHDIELINHFKHRRVIIEAGNIENAMQEAYDVCEA